MRQHTLLTALLISSFFCGCEHYLARPDNNKNQGTGLAQRVYFYTYDRVWNAAHAAISYTTAMENQDAGVLETDSIDGYNGWLPPDIDRPKASGLRYKLVFNFTRGKMNGRDSTKVTIEKKIEIHWNILNTEVVPSDGLEERVIFYRIERELQIADALRTAGKAQ